MWGAKGIGGRPLPFDMCKLMAMALRSIACVDRELLEVLKGRGAARWMCTSRTPTWGSDPVGTDRYFYRPAHRNTRPADGRL